MNNLQNLQNKTYQYCRILGIEPNPFKYPPIEIYPFFVAKNKVFSDGDFVYYDEIDNKYSYVGMERGKEHLIASSSSEEDILYKICERMTFSLASKYSSSNPKSGYSFRDNLFEKQLELLSKVSSKFSKLREIEINKIV